MLKYAEPKVVVIGIQLAVIRYEDLVDISIWSYPCLDPDERERETDRQTEKRNLGNGQVHFEYLLLLWILTGS